MKFNKILPILISFIIISVTILPTVVLSREKLETNEKDITNNSIDENQQKDEENQKKEKMSTENENSIYNNNEIVEEKNKNNELKEDKYNEKIVKSRNIQDSSTQELENFKNQTSIIKENGTSNSLSVSYRTHVQNDGWQDYVQDGEMSGTSGRGLRLEGINIKLLNNNENIKVKYQVHVQNVGWQGWKYDDDMAGTSGQALRLEGIKIELESTEKYSIKYRVHVQDIGWQDWKYDGDIAGTSGRSLRLEAIEIQIVEKQKIGKLNIDTPNEGKIYHNNDNSNIEVSGWKMANVSNTYIKAYIDGRQIDSNLISYFERQDVLNAIKDYGTEVQNPTPGFKFNLDISELVGGNHTIKIELYAEDVMITSNDIIFKKDTSVHIQYRTHVQNEGWQDYVQDGKMSGTSGQGLRLEAINIKLFDVESIKVKYQVHVQNIGWQDWKKNDEMAGTSGSGLRLEGIKIELENTENYSVMYRAHVQDIGWQEWKYDGEMAGTSNRGLRLEAIEIQIVEKQKKGKICIDTPFENEIYYKNETSKIEISGWKMANISNTYTKAYLDDKEIDLSSISYYERPDVINVIKDFGTAVQNPTPGYKFNLSISELSEGEHYIKIELYSNDKIITTEIRKFTIDSSVHIKYQSHIEDIGWQEEKKDSDLSGTVGEAKRIEALKIQLFNQNSNAHIRYRAHVQDIGWQNYVQDGELTGTTNQSKRIEAIQMELEGLDDYTIEYRVHIQSKGWQVWASDGMIAGTVNQSLRIEAIQIRIVKKENAVVPCVKYANYTSSDKWSVYSKNGNASGDAGSGINLEGIKLYLENVSNSSGIKYKVHVQNVGWMDYVKNDMQAGSFDGNALEAVKIELENLEGYSIEYRTYVNEIGWQEWVTNGKISGTTGKGLQIGAIQIRLHTNYYNDSNQSNFESIDTLKYQGYKELLEQLQTKHPNWTIKLHYTGLDWNDVLNHEDNVDWNGSPYSLTDYTGNWRNSSDTKNYGSGFYRASREAIAYMMDPRNSLDEYYVFQFQELASSSGTYDQIKKMISGSYLEKYNITNNILQASIDYNVSPFHLVSRMKQEQGTNGWSVNGYWYNGRTVYNFCNIGATGKSDQEIIASGAQYAYDNHWFTPEMCINGSAKFLHDKYFSRGQSTLYFQKYNVITASPYTNQYMQNIRAANDEGYRIAKSYENNGLLNSSFTFTIPVYENMPSSACSRPSR